MSRTKSSSHLLKKGDKFAHEVAKDPTREGVERGSEGHTAHQEGDVCGSKVCCRLRKTNINGLSQTHSCFQSSIYPQGLTPNFKQNITVASTDH